MHRHSTEPTEGEPFSFSEDDRANVTRALKRYMLDPKKLAEVIVETERAIQIGLDAGRAGLGHKLRRVAPSVRKELEELAEIAERLKKFRGSLSKDAEWLLIATDSLSRRFSEENPEGKAHIRDGTFALVDARSHPRTNGFDLLERAELILKSWASRALATLDEPTLKRPPGPPRRLDLRLAGEALADVWIKYTGKRAARHGWRDEGPFVAFLGAALRAIEPDFDGVRLAREIQEHRKMQGTD